MQAQKQQREQENERVDIIENLPNCSLLSGNKLKRTQSHVPLPKPAMFATHDPLKDSGENPWLDFTTKDFVKRNIKMAKLKTQFAQTATEQSPFKPKKPWLKHCYATVERIDKESLSPRLMQANLRANQAKTLNRNGLPEKGFE